MVMVSFDRGLNLSSVCPRHLALDAKGDGLLSQTDECALHRRLDALVEDAGGVKPEAIRRCAAVLREIARHKLSGFFLFPPDRSQVRACVSGGRYAGRLLSTEIGRKELRRKVSRRSSCSDGVGASSCLASPRS